MPSSSSKAPAARRAGLSECRFVLVCKKSICSGKIMSQELLQSRIIVIFVNHFNSKVCQNFIPGECDSGEQQ